MRHCLVRLGALGRLGRLSVSAVGLVSVVAVLVLAPGASAGQSLGDLNAQIDNVSLYDAPVSVDSVSASATLNGVWSDDVALNDNDLAVTNPSIEVNSASPISDFPALGGSFSSFPVFGVPQATLNPGETYQPNLDLQSTLPLTFSSGVDAVRSVSPTSIPVGGTDQLVTVAVTPTLPGQGLKVGVQEWPENASFVSSSAPSNLNQGEILIGGGDAFVLINTVPGKTYTFTFTLSVPNPYGAPFDAKPQVDVVGVQALTTTCCSGPSSSVTVNAPSLNGEVTYSVDQTVPAWSVTEGYESWVSFLGGILPPTSKDECKDGGWQTYGIFKNQGDCVSYVATKGKNPPNG
jgi:hypothetical protein